VLSGNRNFEGRINPHVRANYLASPPLVIAFAIAGSVDANIMDEPLAKNDRGEAVYLRDIWPTQQEVNETMQKCLTSDLFTKEYDNVAAKSPEWNAIPVKAASCLTGTRKAPTSRSRRSSRTSLPSQADRRNHRRDGAGDGRRFGHDRSHFPRRLH